MNRYRAFLRGALERAAKTGAQAALLTLGAGQLDAFSVSWQTVAGFAVGGAVLSLLTSAASLPFGPPDSPSLVRESP